MPTWASPFPLAEHQRHQLEAMGWAALEIGSELIPDDAVMGYDAPDALLAHVGLEPGALLAGFQALLACPLERRLIPLRLLLPDQGMDPVSCALTQALIQQQQGLLDAYLDLELRADLQGAEPDVNYVRRLREGCDPLALSAAWNQHRMDHQHGLEMLQSQLSASRAGEAEAREEVELTLLQLHQVQEELEQVFLADRAKAQELEAVAGVQEECEGLRQELAAARAQLEAERGEQAGLRERERGAREEVELTLLQLHQVQEELEHYFLLARGQTQQIDRYDELHRRSQRLLAQLVPQV